MKTSIIINEDEAHILLEALTQFIARMEQAENMVAVDEKIRLRWEADEMLDQLNREAAKCGWWHMPEPVEGADLDEFKRKLKIEHQNEQIRERGVFVPFDKIVIGEHITDGSKEACYFADHEKASEQTKRSESL